eukprot:3068909-Prymnesium_polylepis.1
MTRRSTPDGIGGMRYGSPPTAGAARHASVVGDVLHDAHRLAAGHRLCSVDSYARTGRGSRTSGDR